MKPVGTGALFGKQGHSEFLAVTGSRYDAMVARLQKKKLPPMGFTKEEFREFVLAALGGHEDGVIQCKYCHKVCTLKEVTPDHEIPLSRGGDSHWSNLGLPCQRCNQQKGSLTPDEFRKLLEFLERYIPLGRQDVLSRLEKAVKLAATVRRSIMLANKDKAPAKRKEDDGLPPF